MTAAALAALAGAAGMFAHPPSAARQSAPVPPARGGFFSQIARAFMASGSNQRGGLGGYRKHPRGSHKQKRRIQMAAQRRRVSR